MESFLQAKQEFDKKYSSQKEFMSFIPTHLKISEVNFIKRKDGKRNEEYYKWQFFYSLVYSGLYQKDYVGCEVHFPKGSKSSASIILDGAIFDDPKWFEWYKRFYNNKDQESLDWLRKHLIGVIEFKENSKNIETAYNQQLKSYMKESENSFCLGILYDAERLYLFQKRNGNFLRFDESYNFRNEEATSKNLHLHLTDAYEKIPSFDELKKASFKQINDRSKRTIDDLNVIEGIHSKQFADSISEILKTMDRTGMKNQTGYKIIVQVLALKIFDEKRSSEATPRAYLEFYKNNSERIVTKVGKGIVDLENEETQKFIERIIKLYKEAARRYHHVLDKKHTNTISWDDDSHIELVSELVEQFQDYSLVNSPRTTDLHQLVFYKFASEFSKADKGQFITPIPLVDFLVEIVNPRGNETVIDPTVGIADFLSASYIKGGLDDSNIYGIDNDKDMIMLAQLNMLLSGDGKSVLKYAEDKGSITQKFDDRGDELVKLNPVWHKNGNWDNWKNQKSLKKFDVVLTNPPFGQGRKYESKTKEDREIIEMYELWHVLQKEKKEKLKFEIEALKANKDISSLEKQSKLEKLEKAKANKEMKSIDPGLIFLENAYHILKDNGRMGIVLSNSIASIETWEGARKWLMQKMRIVALFDLPPNIFTDTGANTTLVVAYKPKNDGELKKLQKENYSIFIKEIKKVGYEIRTINRVKFPNPIYKRNKENLNEIEMDEYGKPSLEEEFKETIDEFKKWCRKPEQEEKLRDLFTREK